MWRLLVEKNCHTVIREAQEGLVSLEGPSEGIGEADIHAHALAVLAGSGCKPGGSADLMQWKEKRVGVSM